MNKTIQCVDCKEKVFISKAFVSTCGYCGTDYNAVGQKLAPRDQWGEETGENLFDMMNGSDDDY